MAKLSDILLKALSTDVFVTIAPDAILFQRNEVQVSIKTVIFLSLDEKKPIIVGVGDELTSSAANKRIDLFKPNSWDQFNPSKKEALCAFFKHAMLRIHKNSKNIVRPKMIVKNSNSLETILCGYQQDILKDVLEESGAREVFFES